MPLGLLGVATTRLNAPGLRQQFRHVDILEVPDTFAGTMSKSVKSIGADVLGQLGSVLTCGEATTAMRCDPRIAVRPRRLPGGARRSVPPPAC